MSARRFSRLRPRWKIWLELKRKPVFGDGKQPISFQPQDTRPEYYVVFVDSGWSLDNYHSDRGHCVCDHYDEIVTALEEEFGCCDDEGMEEEGWPVVHADSGAGWCELDE